MSLIYSRSRNNGVLDLETIKRNAPAAFASDHAEHLTDRYQQLFTADFIPVLADYGYHPVQAVQSHRKGKSTAEHRHHFIAFAEGDTYGGQDTGTRPEIILYNSHDGSGAVRMIAGAYRFICSNGIIAGDGFQSRVYHTKSSMNKFPVMLKDTIASLPLLMDRIEHLKQIEVATGSPEYNEFVNRAFLTRWDDSKMDSYTLNSLGRSIRRHEDLYQDAWTVFNRIQENVIRGGTMIKSLTEDNKIKYRKAGAIGSVKETMRINSELWEVAEDVFEIA